jgi:hypothetical protein
MLTDLRRAGLSSTEAGAGRTRHDLPWGRGPGTCLLLARWLKSPARRRSVSIAEVLRLRAYKRSAQDDDFAVSWTSLPFVIPTGANPDFLPRSNGQGPVCALP